jgi:mannan endo-1,4-beta-mannosidase
MVSLGDEGWLSQEDTFDDPSSTAGFGYNGYNGVDFTKNFEIDTLDYGTVHCKYCTVSDSLRQILTRAVVYPSLWSESYSWGVQWIRHHDEIGARVGTLPIPSVLPTGIGCG